MIVNLTPHAITIVDGSQIVATIPPSGRVARVAVTSVPADPVDGLPVTRQITGDVTGLPPPAPDTWYLVSLPCRLAAQADGREDVLSPGELVRTPDGQPIGCRGLAR